MIRTYFRMLLEEEMPGAEGKMKQFASWFTHGVPGGAALRKAIYEAAELGRRYLRGSKNSLQRGLRRVHLYFDYRLQ